MNIRRKKIWLVLGLLIALAAGAIAMWLASSRGPTQFVTLSDGVKYRFVGVTWGTNHDDLTDQRFVAKVVNHLPTRVANYVRRKFGVHWKLRAPLNTPVPSLCVWLKRVATNGAAGGPGLGYVILADGKGVEAGSESTEPFFPSAISWPGTAWPGAIFQMVPRRSRILECHFYAHPPGSIPTGPRWTSSFVSGTGPAIPTQQPELGRIRFRNPLYGRYPQWQPETLPAIKSVGDLEVHLSNCIAGIDIATPRNMMKVYRAPAPGELAAIHFDLQAVSSSRKNEQWVPLSTVLSDATGNALTNSHFIDQQGSFWPDEQAVRLHAEFKRVSGFPSADLITFTNVPLPRPKATEGAALTNVVHRIPIVLRNFSTEDTTTLPGFPSFVSGEHPSAPYHLEVEVPAELGNEAVDLIEIKTDAGELVDYQSGNDSGQFRRRSFRSLPAGARSLTVTAAVQKLQTVDFFVKPVTPKPE